MQNLYLDDDGEFHANGRVKERYISGSNVSELVSDILRFYRILGETYSRYMGNDSKIIGQEKANLKLVIEALFQSLLGLRFYLERNYLHNNVPSAVNSEAGYRFTMYLDQFDYTLMGRLSTREFNQINKFSIWYREQLGTELKVMIAEMKQALEDKILSREEVISLNKEIDSMIHSILIILYKLEHSSLTS